MTGTCNQYQGHDVKDDPRPTLILTWPQFWAIVAGLLTLAAIAGALVGFWLAAVL